MTAFHVMSITNAVGTIMFPYGSVMGDYCVLA